MLIRILFYLYILVVASALLELRKPFLQWLFWYPNILIGSLRRRVGGTLLWYIIAVPLMILFEWGLSKASLETLATGRG
ncbi:hypothetical protein EV356DRAFT_93564 [Viridothelium virens]|uniref:Uncharacterized protein n=1 Tax=Viridothelium virens TaxID=1048519 RepID=A0A6A6HD23_VIRVR|nr:hypothetical protein EV356DRAFT_93564 [Viridothelium virens]